MRKRASVARGGEGGGGAGRREGGLRERNVYQKEAAVFSMFLLHSSCSRPPALAEDSLPDVAKDTVPITPQRLNKVSFPPKHRLSLQTQIQTFVATLTNALTDAKRAGR
jgi:hypothetical protein